MHSARRRQGRLDQPTQNVKQGRREHVVAPQEETVPLFGVSLYPSLSLTFFFFLGQADVRASEGRRSDERRSGREGGRIVLYEAACLGTWPQCHQQMLFGLVIKTFDIGLAAAIPILTFSC